MTARQLYIYDTGPAADAARHLIACTALQHVTNVTEDWGWAGSNSTMVTLTTPRPSEGEAALWQIAEAWSRGDGFAVDMAAMGHLDADNRSALLVAVGIALGFGHARVAS